MSRGVTALGLVLLLAACEGTGQAGGPAGGGGSQGGSGGTGGGGAGAGGAGHGGSGGEAGHGGSGGTAGAGGSGGTAGAGGGGQAGHGGSGGQAGHGGGAGAGGAIPELDAATLLGAQFPASLPCGGAGEARILFRNDGSSTWTSAGGFKLGAVGDSDPFHAPDPRRYLSDTDAIAPGSTHLFVVPLSAPATPGPQLTDWQLVHEGVRWFGDLAAATVEVTCAAPIDATTLDRKHLLGYQGWFGCANDGSPVSEWSHWFRGSPPEATNASFDLWPDVSELPAEERCDTSMTLAAGGPAQLFSSWNPATVDRHFAWMESAGLDGVLLQRFSSELGDPRFFALRDGIAGNVRAGAEAHGRVFALMYDLSGTDDAILISRIQEDWRHLVEDVGLTSSDRYLRDGGLPVLGLWGIGFDGRTVTPAQLGELLDWLQRDAPPHLRARIIGGVPSYWRTRTGDASPDVAWDAVYARLDVVNPWAVGRFADDAGADDYRRNVIVPDLALTSGRGQRYMPVVFPGFSWTNLTFAANPLNQIPRRGGRFYWRQVNNAVTAGSTMIFGAMFDESDEGTAMYKAAPSQAQLPIEGTFLPLDADGEAIPSDFYLRLAGEASRLLRGEIPPGPGRPISP